MKRLTYVLCFALAVLQIVLGSAALFGYFGTKWEDRGLPSLLPQELPLIGYSSTQVDGKSVYVKMDRDAFNARVKAVQRRDHLEAMIFAYDNRERQFCEELDGLLVWMLVSGGWLVVGGVLSLGFISRNRKRQ